MDKQLQPLVTVCIANYNGAETLPSGSSLLEECIESVLMQALDANFEVVVYDDASNDESVEILRAKYASSVTLIQGTENVGYCAANNAMAEKASGKYLLLLNNDAALRPGALQALSNESLRDSSAILSLEQHQSTTMELIDMGMGLDIFAVPYPLKYRSTKKLVTVIGACLWVETDYFLNLGGFPIWMESIGEDLFLCLSARSTGRNVSIATGSSYLHHSGFSFGGGKADKTGTTTFRRRFLSERNRLSILLIFFPLISLAPLTLAVLFMWCLEAIVLSLTQRSLRPFTEVYLPAIRDVVRFAPRIFQQRRLSQNVRTQSNRDFFRMLSLVPVKLKFLLTNGVPRLSA